MSSAPAISVIIPVYNTRPYLEECLNSVLAQTGPTKEIICIDDGSTDGSLELLREYRRKHDIAIMENSWPHGQAFARNQGIRAARGEFIYFMDSDDWIDPDYLQAMHAAITRGYDCVVNTAILWEYPNSSKRWDCSLLAWPDAVGKVFAPAKKYIAWHPAPVWAHLYRTSFLREHGLLFPSGYKTNPYIHEDGFYQYAVYLHCDAIYGVCASTYHYRQHEISTMSLSQDDRCYNYFATFDMTYDYLVAKNLLSEYQGKLFYILREFMMNSIRDYVCCKRFFSKIADHYIQFKSAYNPIDIFFYDAIIHSDSFDGYMALHRSNIYVAFIQYLHRQAKNRA